MNHNSDGAIRTSAVVARHDEPAPCIHRLTLYHPEAVSAMRAGCFVHLLAGGSAYLRRPISVCRVRREEGLFDVVFQVRGEGTRLLSQKREGETVDFIGPLGNFFPLEGESIAVVGGGIGIYPLLALLDDHPAPRKTAYLGFRNRSLAHLTDEFAALAELNIATDDGSLGRKALVPALLEEKIASFDRVYACGPLPMLRAVASAAEKNGILCYVSMEERMACGVGACLVCACKVKAAEGGYAFEHVCSDGPVFDSRKIVWEGAR